MTEENLEEKLKKKREEIFGRPEQTDNENLQNSKTITTPKKHYTKKTKYQQYNKGNNWPAIILGAAMLAAVITAPFYEQSHKNQYKNSKTQTEVDSSKEQEGISNKLAVDILPNKHTDILKNNYDSSKINKSKKDADNIESLVNKTVGETSKIRSNYVQNIPENINRDKSITEDSNYDTNKRNAEINKNTSNKQSTVNIEKHMPEIGHLYIINDSVTYCDRTYIDIYKQKKFIFILNQENIRQEFYYITPDRFNNLYNQGKVKDLGYRNRDDIIEMIQNRLDSTLFYTNNWRFEKPKTFFGRAWKSIRLFNEEAQRYRH